MNLKKVKRAIQRSARTLSITIPGGTTIINRRNRSVLTQRTYKDLTVNATRTSEAEFTFNMNHKLWSVAVNDIKRDEVKKGLL